MKTLVIKWQRLLDEGGQTCPRCGLTEGEVDSACQSLKQALAPLGIEVVLEKRSLVLGEFIKDPLQSNRILIDGRPIEEWLGAKVGQSKCCDVCGDSECRTVEIENYKYETIPASLIIKAGLMAASRILPAGPSLTGNEFLSFRKKGI